MFKATIALNKASSLRRSEQVEKNIQDALSRRNHSTDEITLATPRNGSFDGRGRVSISGAHVSLPRNGTGEDGSDRGSQSSDNEHEIQMAARAFERKKQAEKDRSFILRNVFWIGPSDKEFCGSKLIHPGSPFGQTVAFITTMLLLYVAIVTPVAIGFYWGADPCDKSPLQEFDMALDCWFLCEILLNFVSGSYSPQGIYVDELKVVATRYLKTDFAFDLATSIPVAIIEYFSQLACSDGGDAAVPAAQLRIVRATKPLRIFKMLRVLKTSKLLIVLDYLEAALRPPPFMTRMLRMLFSIFMIVHICACCFWLIKDLSSTDHEIAEFLGENNLDPDAWLGNKYLLSAYFVNTVFTTVGFGDIHANTQAERVFVVIIMYVGTLVFGTMLGEVQNAMAQLRKGVRERSAVAQEVKDYLRDHQVPRDLESKLMAWVNFNEDCKHRQNTRRAVWDRFPTILRRQLATHLQDDAGGGGESLLAAVAVLGELVHRDRFNFLLDLYMCMESETFGRGLPIAVKGHQADKLLFVRSGSVHVTSTEDKDGPVISTLVWPDHFGEYALFEDAEWEESYWSNSFVECWTLSRQAFTVVLSMYDESLEQELSKLAEAARVDREHTAWIKDRPRLARWRTLLVKVGRKVHQMDRARGFEKFKRYSEMASFKMANGVRKRAGSAERRTSFTFEPSSRASSQASRSGSSPEATSVHDISTKNVHAVVGAQPQTPSSERAGESQQLVSPKGIVNSDQALNILHRHSMSALPIHASAHDDLGHHHHHHHRNSIGGGGGTHVTHHHPALLGPDVTRMLKQLLDGQHHLKSQVTHLASTLEVVRADLHRTHLEVSDLIKKERREVRERRRSSLVEDSSFQKTRRERSGSVTVTSDESGSGDQHRKRSGESPVQPGVDVSGYRGSFVARGPEKLRPASPAAAVKRVPWGEGREKRSRRASIPVEDVSVASVDAALVYDDGTAPPQQPSASPVKHRFNT